jgi:hypothetical protein
MNFLILRDVDRDGASLNAPEAKDQLCAACDAALALLPWSPK